MDDLFLVNGNYLHFVNTSTGYKDTQVLVLQIDSNHLKNYGIHMAKNRFQLNSGLPGSVPAFVFDEIRCILAQMMDAILNQKNFTISG